MFKHMSAIYASSCRSTAIFDVETLPNLSDEQVMTILFSNRIPVKTANSPVKDKVD